ncbi:MAG: ABC transporter permease [Ilumatobacteraceae bacterium]
MATITTAQPTLRIRKRRTRPPLSVALGIGFFLSIVVVSLIGRSWAGSPTAQSLRETSKPPSGAHWLGTDALGRDIVARVLAGTNTAILGPLLIAASGLILSSLLGIAAAYLGGLTDTVIMRWVDFMLALPGLLVAIVVVSVLGGGYAMAIVLLSIFNVQGDIRIVRGAAIEQKPLPYIEALRSLGIKRRRIMFRHILPNVAPILVANFAIDFALALVALAGLSFLGLGSEPGTPEWGAILAENQSILFSNPAASLAPGVVIILLAVSVNLVGDWIYDRYSAPERLTSGS